MHATNIAEPAITPDEFLDMPDSIAFELVGGQLEERNVSALSSQVAARIIYLLQAATNEIEDFRVYGADLTYRCFPKDPDMMRRADVSLILALRLVDLGKLRVMPIPADLAVEVLSSNDLAYKVDEKIELYLETGFGLVWVVNPEMKSVSVHRSNGTVSKLHETDEISGETALPGFKCKVAEFFRRGRFAAPAQT